MTVTDTSQTPTRGVRATYGTESLMKNGSSNGRIGPAGLLDPTIATVNGIEFEVFEAGRRVRSMTRATSLPRRRSASSSGGASSCGSYGSGPS